MLVFDICWTMSCQNPISPSDGTQENFADLNVISRVNQTRASPPTSIITHETEEDEELNPNVQQNRTQPDNTDNSVTVISILHQVCEEASSESEWMRLLSDKIPRRFKRMPRGGWKIVQDEFNRKFNKTALLIDVKNAYSRAKSGQTRTREDGRSRDGPEFLPLTIKNTNLYIKVKTGLFRNIEVASQDEHVTRKRTRKIYSQEINQDVVDMLNTAIIKENIGEKAKSLKALNDIFYACQLTYEEVTTKAKKENNWKDAINKKIDKFERQIQIISNHNQQDVPSHAMIQLCKNNSIHTNNEGQILKLKDQLEEKKGAFGKKLDISKKRIAFRQANKLFEFNRKMFYRKLDDEKAEIDELIDKDEVLNFWKRIWSTNEEEENFQELTDLMPICDLKTIPAEEKTKTIIEEKIKFLANWKTPGPEQVYNYFIKCIHSLHGKMIELIQNAIKDPSQIDEELYIGNTYLISKVPKANKGKDLRPITCLPNIYKLLSKVVSALLSDFCDVNEVVSENQMGTRRGCQGAKQQALLNKNLNQKYDNKLFTSWIDVQKAYDSIHHRYLIEILERMEVPLNMIAFVSRTLRMQQTNLICNKQDMGRVEIKKGLLQGDSLSPLLFVVAMEPVSRQLIRCCEKVKMGDFELNHLIFIDDIKLFAKDEETLVDLCRTTNECLGRMKLQVNQEKSASNVDNDLTFGSKLDDAKGYKYLGVLEDSRNIIKEDNKRILEERLMQRTTRLCQTKLNAVNLFRGINEFAVSTFNYYIGLIPYEPKEFEELDKKVRRVLCEYKITRNACNIDRLYLKRDQLGRGLTCLADKAELMLLNLNEFLSKNIRTQCLIKNEREQASHLGLIREFLQTKYQLDSVNPMDLKKMQEMVRKNRIQEKKMHGVLYKDDDNTYDQKISSMWLKKGNITPQQEGMLTKLQDRNLYFGGTSVKCPHCKQGRKCVEHLATHCGRMLNFDYKKRHDEVVRCLHFQFTKRYGLNKNHRLKNYCVQNVLSNERVKIKSDVPILTELRIDHNKPDLMVHDLRAKEILLVEVGITNKNIISTTELTKARKYELLANELKCIYPGTKVTIVPVVMTWDGLVTKHFKAYMKQIDVSDKLVSYIQTVVLKRTLESILIDSREGNENWLDEENSARLEQLETEREEED